MPPKDASCPPFTFSAEQEAAASTDARRALVLAGPGAGKTATLLRRVEVLLGRGVPGASILVLVFSKDVEIELQGRKPSGLPSPSITTFDAQAVRRVKADPAGFGLPNGVTVMDDDEFKREIRRSSEGAWPRSDLRKSLEDTLRSAYARTLPLAEFRRGFPELGPAEHEALVRCVTGLAHLKARGRVSLAEWMPMLVTRMSRDAGYRRAAYGGIAHVIVDEYQDLDPAQAAFLDHLYAEGACLWAVGDEDQCIFGFRSADVTRSIGFREAHPDARMPVLRENHRCADAIVRAAANLISHNLDRSNKPPQVPMTGVAGSVECKWHLSGEEETRWVVALVAGELAAGRTVAVLSRVGRRQEAVALAVRERFGKRAEVTTVHRAKGRQWDTVVVLGLEEDHMPLKPNDEEERRIFYVALTRAVSRVVLTSATRPYAGVHRDYRKSAYLEHMNWMRPSPARTSGDQRPD